MIEINGKVFVVSGPSAVGKDTLVSRILMNVPERGALPAVKKIISTTARDPRPGEKDGVDYNFLKPVEFREQLHAGTFIEHAVVHGVDYGLRRCDVETVAENGHAVVILDVQGYAAMRELYGEAVVGIFIVAPSTKDLLLRMTNRRGISNVTARLVSAKEELSHAFNYDYVIVNDSTSSAVVHMTNIIEAEILRCAGHQSLLKQLIDQTISEL